MAQKKFEDVDRIKDPDGVVAIITRSLANNALAVGFFKEFSPIDDDDGPVERTAFMREKHLAAVERLIPKLRERIAQLKEKYPLAPRQKD